MTALAPPSGTVTFLFTDIEGSTRLWEVHSGAMAGALARHDAIVRGAIEGHGGYVFATGGDGFAAAFARAGDAEAAATDAQILLATEAWDEAVIRVRMGLHCGEAEERDGDYFGTAVNRAARVMAAGHGGQTIATQAFAELAGTDTLVDLGEHRLRDLATSQRVFQVGDGDFPPLRTLDAYPTNLPHSLSSFIGRGGVVEALARDIEEHHLVTLSGTGGVGKTRTAAQVCADLLPHFTDGAWFVELAPLRDGEQIASAVAAACGIAERPGESIMVTLASAFASRSMIVVLDNCEHLVDEVADFVTEITGQPITTHLVVTSREALGVPGEQVRRVVSMDVADAAQLFVSRAEAVRADVDWVDHVDDLVQICERLDGIPLAIELAASRSRAMMPADILDRLDERFRLLSGGRRGGRERHQTLLAAVEWSYELLEADERELFDRLAVFRGSFDLAAVESVCTGGPVEELDVIDLLERLVDKSMVTTVSAAGPARYRLLETMRQYAETRLAQAGASEGLRERHFRHFAALAAQWIPALNTMDQPTASARLSAELDNLDAVFEWLLDRDRVSEATLLGLQLTPLWGQSGSAAGRYWSEVLLDRSMELPDPELRLELVAQAVFVLFSAGGWRRAIELIDELERLLGDDLSKLDPRTHFARAQLAMERQEVDQFSAAADLAAAAAERHGDSYWQLLVSVALVGARLVRDPADGLIGAQEFLDEVRPLGIGTLTASGYLQVGQGLLRTGQISEAEGAFRQAAEDAVGVSPHIEMYGILALGMTAAEQTRPGALSHLAQAMALYRDHPVAPGTVVGGLQAAAYALAQQDRLIEAATCVGASRALQESLGVKGEKFLQEVVGVVVEQIDAATADPAIAAAERRGHEMTQFQFCQFVIDLAAAS